MQREQAALGGRQVRAPCLSRAPSMCPVAETEMGRLPLALSWHPPCSDPCVSITCPHSPHVLCSLGDEAFRDMTSLVTVKWTFGLNLKC